MDSGGTWKTDGQLWKPAGKPDEERGQRDGSAATLSNGVIIKALHNV